MVIGNPDPREFSEERVQAYYRNHQEQFMRPVSMRVRHTWHPHGADEGGLTSSHFRKAQQDYIEGRELAKLHQTPAGKVSPIINGVCRSRALGLCLIVKWLNPRLEHLKTNHCGFTPPHDESWSGKTYWHKEVWSLFNQKRMNRFTEAALSSEDSLSAKRQRAGEGNRTLVSGLGSPHSTIEPHPRAARRAKSRMRKYELKNKGASIKL